MKNKVIAFIFILFLTGGFLSAQTSAPTPAPTQAPAAFTPCPCAALPAGGYFDIHGVVRDAYSAVPVNGAYVRYSLVDYPNYSGSSSTNTAGYYRFNVSGLPCTVPAGIIVVSADGYITKEINIGPRSGCSANLINIELESDGSQPTPVPASTYSISGSVNIDASIRIQLTGTTTTEVLTDSAGHYLFTDLTPGAGYTIEPLPDSSVPPQVSITSPGDNETISGVVEISTSIETDRTDRVWYPGSRSITALRSDLTNEDFYQVFSGSSLSLTNVTFSIDNNEEQTGAAQSFRWDTRLFYNGTHTVKVTATDELGNTGSREINLFINNTSPSGDSYAGHITISETPVDYGNVQVDSYYQKSLSFSNLNKNEVITLDHVSFYDEPVLGWGTFLGLYTLGTEIYPRPYPMPITDAVFITSNMNTFIIKEDGSLWGWGYNGSGSLGLGHNKKVEKPVMIFPGDVAKVAAGESHALVMKTDGSLWTCGRNYEGQLGDGTTESRKVFARILSSGVADVAAGINYSLIIKTDGTLWGFGNNYCGQLGLPDLSMHDDVRVPTQIDITGVKKAACGREQTLVLKNDGSLWACGINDRGQVGDGSSVEYVRTLTEIVSTGVIDIACGDYFSLFIKEDHSLWGFGWNRFGQLGMAANETEPLPIQTIPTGVASVSAGHGHTLITKVDGSLWACGDNSPYCLGTGDDDDRTTPVMIVDSGVSLAAAGYNHSVCVRTVPVPLELDISFPLHINPDTQLPFALSFSSTVPGVYGNYMNVVKDDGELLLGVPVTAEVGPAGVQGDVNSDGAVDILDGLLVAQYYVGLNPVDFDPSAADVNCDSVIDILDALLICQYYVGLISQFC